MDTIELKNGRLIECKSLTKDEFDTLLKNKIEKPLNRYTEQYGVEVYILTNQHILVKESDYYTLYLSLTDLDEVLSDFYGSLSKGTEILLNKNKYGQHFPENTTLLISELLDTLGIENKLINEDILKIVDTKINTLKDSKTFRKRHLLNFIALVGEMLIKKYNAKWKMNLASDNVTWNPSLLIKDKSLPIFTYLYEDIFNEDYKEAFLLFEIYQTVCEIEK